MKTPLAILVVFSAFAGVYSFFGLPVEIPDLQGQLETVWKYPLGDNSTVQDMLNEVLIYDEQRLVSSFKSNVETVRNTLDAVHARLVDGVANTNGDTEELFRQLKEDIQNAVPVISEAKSNIASLSEALHNPEFIRNITDNSFGEMFANIPNLLNVVNYYETAALQIQASSIPITSEYISELINENPNLYQVWPVAFLATDINNLYDAYDWTVQMRHLVIGQQLHANQTIEANFNNFTVFVNEISTNMSNAAIEVTTKLKQRAESYLVIMQNTFNYTSILDPAYYNYGEKIITDYFANLTIVIKNCYELYLPELTSNLQNNVTLLLEDQKQTFEDSISEAVQSIFDSAAISHDPNSYHCVDETIYQMLQDFSAADRLKVCYQPEPALIAEIYQEAKTSLDAIINYILIPQEMFTLCDSSSGACFNKFVKHMPKYVQRMKPHIAGALRRIAKKMHLSRSRMQLCGQLVHADMMDFFDQQKVTFHTCLQGQSMI